jgi:NhaA family Na+:H+ antiporter
MHAPTPSRPPSALRALLTSEAGGGLVLMASAGLALALANSPAAPAYFGALKPSVSGCRSTTGSTTA